MSSQDPASAQPQDPTGAGKEKEQPPPLFSNPRRGEEVRALLDMLSLGKYSAAFNDSGKLNTVNDLIDHPNLWKLIIKGMRERETLEGYLSLRQSKPAKEVEASEMRLRTFTVVRTTLKQLRDLQLRKAEMERSFLIQKGVAKKISKDSGSSEEARKKLDDLLDEIDDCKDRLESAQTEMQQNPVVRQPKKVLKPSTLKPKRPMSAPTTQKKQQDSNMNGGGVFSPRLSGEEPEIPSLSNPYAYGMGTAAGGASTARPASAGRPQPQKQPQTHPAAAADRDEFIKGMPPPDSSYRPKTGKFLFEPDFGNSTSQSSAAKDTEVPMARAPKAQLAASCDAGSGWNRKTPVTRMDLLNQKRVSNLAEKHKRKLHADEEMHRQQVQYEDEARRKAPSIRKAQVFASASGSNGIHVNSSRQQGPAGAPAATNASQRRPASSSATKKPMVTGVTARMAPSRFAQVGGDQDLKLTGLKATRFSLGLSGTGVCVDHNDYIQMKCGAVNYPGKTSGLKL